MKDVGTTKDAVMNIAIQYELHLLGIIDTYNRAYTVEDFITMSKQVELLYQGVYDKACDFKPRGKAWHENKKKEVAKLRRNYAFWNDKTSGHVHIHPAEYALLVDAASRLADACHEWKQELIVVMSKNNMLVTHHKGIAGAIDA